MKKILAPSILSADFANLGRDVLTAIDAGFRSRAFFARIFRDHRTKRCIFPISFQAPFDRRF